MKYSDLIIQTQINWLSNAKMTAQLEYYFNKCMLY